MVCEFHISMRNKGHKQMQRSKEVMHVLLLGGKSSNLIKDFRDITM